jgi:hypothetical protein
VGRSEGEESRPESSIKIDLKEIEWGDMDWIHLAQIRDNWKALVNTVVNHPVP